jgi:hypothetical protein
MITDQEFAVLSLHVYDTGEVSLPDDFEEYMPIPEYMQGEGYFARAYRKISTNEIVIAHRGTNKFPEAISDLDDDSQIARGEVPDQYTFAKMFCSSVENKMISEGKTQIYHTGHSLGGALAQLSSSHSLCHFGFVEKAVVFDSPQVTLYMMDQARPVGYETVDVSSINMFNYCAAPTEINTVNSIGMKASVRRLYPVFDAAQTGDSYSVFSLGSFTWQQHNMVQLLACFSPTTGLPRVYSLPTSWPTDGEAWFESYAQNPHYWDTYFDSQGMNRQQRIDYVNTNLGGFTPPTSGVTIYSDGTAPEGQTPQIFGTTLGSDRVISSTGREEVCVYGTGTLAFECAAGHEAEYSYSKKYYVSVLGTDNPSLLGTNYNEDEYNLSVA